MGPSTHTLCSPAPKAVLWSKVYTACAPGALRVWVSGLGRAQISKSCAEGVARLF